MYRLLKLNFIVSEETFFKKIEIKAKQITVEDCDESIVKDFLKNFSNENYVRSISINYCSLKDVPVELTKYKNNIYSAIVLFIPINHLLFNYNFLKNQNIKHGRILNNKILNFKL